MVQEHLGLPRRRDGHHLLLSGGYKMIERLTTVLVVGVTAASPSLACGLAGDFECISPSDIATGLTFAIPAHGHRKPLAGFGITGVGANELYYYPYWCIEKGYARWAGPRDDSADWVSPRQGLAAGPVSRCVGEPDCLYGSHGVVLFPRAAVLHPHGRGRVAEGPGWQRN
jgi:hypothetical protein